MSPVDLRGFEDALAPLARRRQWQADACARLLGLATQALRAAQADCRAQSAACEEEALHLRERWLRRADPAAHQQQLVRLAALHARLDALQDRAREREQALTRARQDWLRRQRQLEGLQRLREDGERDYALAEGARQMARADDEWRGRALGRDGEAGA
jgi:flagellar biosynthesis chaperone FliJ